MHTRHRVLAVLLGILAAGIATASALGPLMLGVLEYRTSDTTINQVAGGDLAGLVLVAPVAAVAAVLAWRGHRAGPVIGIAPALWAIYMYAQLIVGQEHLRLPGNSEQFFPLLLALFVLGEAATVLAWSAIGGAPLPRAARRLETTAGVVLLVIAAFLVIGLHLPSLVDALDGPPDAMEYTSSPTAFWIVKLMDLGIIVPAAATIGVALLRGAAWARRASYALLGGYTLLSAAVTGMAVVMLINDDPDASAAMAAAFGTFSLALAWLTARLCRPLFGHGSEPPLPDAEQAFSMLGIEQSFSLDDPGVVHTRADP